MNFSLAFPPGQSAYAGGQLVALLALNIFELGSHLLLDSPFALINLLLVFRTSILHPNLKVILLCQSACIFFRATGRILLNTGRLWLLDGAHIASKGPFLFTILYLQPTFVRNFIVHVLVIERILATLLYRTYEKWGGRWLFSAGWLLVTSLVSLANAVSMPVLPTSISQTFSQSIYYTQLGLGGVEILALGWLLQHNERLYRQKAVRTQNLTERYQLSENIRTAKQLIPCILLHYFNIFYGACCTTFTIYRWLGVDQFAYDFYCSQLLYTASSVVSFAIEVSMLIYHPFLKRDLVRLCRKLCHCLIPGANFAQRSPDSHAQVVGTGSADWRNIRMPVNIHGQPLMFTRRGQLEEEHFRQMKDAWQ